MSAALDTIDQLIRRAECSCELHPTAQGYAYLNQLVTIRQEVLILESRIRRLESFAPSIIDAATTSSVPIPTTAPPV